MVKNQESSRKKKRQVIKAKNITWKEVMEFFKRDFKKAAKKLGWQDDGARH